MIRPPEWLNPTRQPVTLEQGYDWCADQDITVHTDVTMPPDITAWGFYHAPTRAILLSRKLPESWILPTLAHETIHAYYEHNGHQDESTERRVNEAVALALVDPAEYAFWENQYGGKAGGIAAKLGLPKWTIEAYQRHLAKTHPCTY